MFFLLILGVIYWMCLNVLGIFSVFRILVVCGKVFVLELFWEVVVFVVLVGIFDCFGEVWDR